MIVRDVASSAPEALSLRHNDGAPMHVSMGKRRNDGDASERRRHQHEPVEPNPKSP